jgi:hypothetical protein
MSWISDDKSDQWDPSKLGLEYAVSNFNDSKYIQFKRFVKQYIIYMMTKASYYCIGAKFNENNLFPVIFTVF